jgi:transcriptional regulator CtsR
MTVMLAAVSDRSLTIAQPAKDILRANALKNMLAALH